MIRPKIAVCVYGRFNNRYSPTSGYRGFEQLLRLVKEHPDFEFSFWVYSTDEREAQTIKTLFGKLGAEILIEPQKDFEAVIRSQGVPIERYQVPGGDRSFANLLSFYYSRSRSIQMMLEGARHEDLEAVLITRFDAGQVDRHNGRQRAKVSAVGFNRFLNRGSIYSAAWDQHNLGYADQWFVCSKAQASTLSLMFDDVKGYLQPGSAYLDFIGKGISDSNVADEFSNERLKDEELKSADLVKLPESEALNGHLMHKFFMLSRGMYEESMFSSHLEDVALVVYSHSDYFDCLFYFDKQIDHHLNSFRDRILLADKAPIDTCQNYQHIAYEDSFSYTERMISSLVQIDSEFIFFFHEDFLITQQPDPRHLLDAIEMIRSGQLDYFNFGRGGIQVGLPVLGRKSIRKSLNRLSPWIFSLQPSIWKRSRFLDLLAHHRHQSIWEFEAAAQATARRIGLKTGFSGRKGVKKGSLHWDNKLFPYIATAIVKGKWNIDEYPKELQSIFSQNNLPDSLRRGRE